MRKPTPLIWHLIPSYLLIILVSLGGVTWFALTSLQTFFIQRTAIDLETRARILAAQVADRLQPVDAAAVSRICRRVGQDTDTRVTVIAADGTVMADSDEEPSRMENHSSRPEVLQALAGGVGRSERFSSTQGQRMMYVALPLEGADAPFAVLRVDFPDAASQGMPVLAQQQDGFGVEQRHHGRGPGMAEDIDVHGHPAGQGDVFGDQLKHPATVNRGDAVDYGVHGRLLPAFRVNGNRRSNGPRTDYRPKRGGLQDWLQFALPSVSGAL